MPGVRKSRVRKCTEEVWLTNSVRLRRKFVEIVTDFRLHRLGCKVACLLASLRSQQLIGHLPRVHLRNGGETVRVY